MTIDLATLRALATSCDHRHGSALLLACDEIEILRSQVAESAARIERLAAMNEGEIARRFAEARDEEIASLRATIARMNTPTLTEFSAIATAALRDSSAAWNGMSDTEKSAIKARVRYGLDYLASSHGVEPGDIYSAGPTDPPSQAPGT